MENEKSSIIFSYLDNYGWKYEVLEDGKVLTRFIGEDSDTEFYLIVSISENWVGLTIWPYYFSIKPDMEGDVAKRISVINFNDVKMARFAQTEKGEIAICIDLPVQGINETLFHRALDMLSYYADIYYPTFVELWSGM